MTSSRSEPARVLPGDCLALVEAFYELEEDEDRWLGLIARRACEVLGIHAHGAYAVTYDASDVTRCRFPSMVMTPEVTPGLQEYLRVDAPQAYEQNPALVEAVFRRTAFGPSQELPLGEVGARLHQKLTSLGVAGILGLNGINLDGRGLHIGVLLPPSEVPPADVLARLSSHLAAASRLRRRLDRPATPDAADAVIQPDGKVVHAEGTAKVGSARHQLTEAVVRLQDARSSVRRRDPTLALSRWTALVAGRWSLIDHFDRDGKKYIVAERNDQEPGPLALLTHRERQVVALAALGHANKMIAYELGIAVSTAGVLLARAAQKLGTASRQELIAAYRSETTKAEA